MHKLMTGAAFTKVGNGNFLGGANLFSGGKKRDLSETDREKFSCERRQS